MSKKSKIFHHNDYTEQYLFMYTVDDEWIDYVTCNDPTRLINRAKGIMEQDEFCEEDWTVNEPHPNNPDAIFYAINRSEVDDDPVVELVILKVKHFG